MPSLLQPTTIPYLHTHRLNAATRCATYMQSVARSNLNFLPEHVCMSCMDYRE
jgi:hypothetical protein